jgi:hypothetical protein
MQATSVETFNKLVTKDGFSAIANYFGRGLMVPPTQKGAAGRNSAARMYSEYKG